MWLSSSGSRPKWLWLWVHCCCIVHYTVFCFSVAITMDITTLLCINLYIYILNIPRLSVSAVCFYISIFNNIKWFILVMLSIFFISFCKCLPAYFIVFKCLCYVGYLLFSLNFFNTYIVIFSSCIFPCFLLLGEYN